MEYKIIEEESPQDLEKAVNAALAQGWAPLGGLSFCSAVYESGTRYYYCQALVRPVPKKRVILPPPPQPPMGSL